MDQQNQNQNMPQEAALPKKHFKAFWPIMIIAVLSALVGGLLVWTAYNAGLDEELNSLLPGSARSMMHKNKKVPQQVETSSSTEGWQTYKNEKYGFEFVYPSTWAVPTIGQNEIEFGCPKQNFEGDQSCPLRIVFGENYFTGDLKEKIKINSYDTEIYEALGNCKDTFAIIKAKPYLNFSDHCSYYQDNGTFNKILNSITFASK